MLAARAGAVFRVLGTPIYRQVFLLAIVVMAGVLVAGELLSVAIVGTLVNHAWPSGLRFNALPYSISLFAASRALDLAEFPILVVLMSFGDHIGLVVAQISLYSAIPMAIMAVLSAVTITLTYASWRESRLCRGEEGTLGGGVAGSVAFVSAGSQMSGILGGCCGGAIPASLATLSTSGAIVGGSGVLTAVLAFLGRFGQIGLIVGPAILLGMVYHLGGVVARTHVAQDLASPLDRELKRPRVVLVASVGVIVVALIAAGRISTHLGSQSAPAYELTRFDARADDPSWSPDGTKLAFISFRSSNLEIWLSNLGDGKFQQLTNNGFYKSTPTWSNDGSRIAFVQMVGAERQVWVLNLSNHSMAQLTHGNGFKDSPVWNPKKSEIAYVSQGFGLSELRSIDLGTKAVRRLVALPGPILYPAWRPDGEALVFTTTTRGESNIWTVKADGSGLRQLSHSPDNKISPTWSPDGRFIAFISDRASKHQIWMMSADGNGERLLFPDAEDVYQVAWSPDGRRLAYVRVNAFANGRIWVWDRVPRSDS